METIKSLVKSNIGLSKDNPILDDKIDLYIKGYISELENINKVKYTDSLELKIYISDYVTWRMKSVDNITDVPQHLKHRLKDILITMSNKNV